MPTHWTYRTVQSDEDLDQGDILAPTDEIKGILQQFHPHFTDNRYLGFLIITQSCDLVRRGCSQGCKARYINLAVVRSLVGVLDDLMKDHCDRLIPGAYTEETKSKAKEMLSRVINQNEQNSGVFYLHQDADAGIGEKAVALLRVTVALRAVHYDALLHSRRGGLNPEFRNKLGWLVGNLYSRIGTPDWGDQEDGEKQQSAIIKELLDGTIWIKRENVEAAKGNGVDIASLDKDNIEATIERYNLPTVLESLIKLSASTTRVILPNITQGDLDKISNRLRNSPELSAILKRAKRG